MAEKKQNTIRVENFEQKALLDLELTGQISDGHWENAKPFDHWMPWCHLDTIVDPSNTGIDFWPKRSYDFAAYDLLKVVRTRMILYVRLARHFGIELAKDLEKCFETIDENCNAMPSIELLKECPDYAEEITKQIFETRRKELEDIAAFPIKSSSTAPFSYVYTLKMLNKDLAALSRIAKTRSSL